VDHHPQISVVLPLLPTVYDTAGCPLVHETDSSTAVFYFQLNFGVDFIWFIIYVCGPYNVPYFWVDIYFVFWNCCPWLWQEASSDQSHGVWIQSVWLVELLFAHGKIRARTRRTQPRQFVDRAWTRAPIAYARTRTIAMWTTAIRLREEVKTFQSHLLKSDVILV